MEEQLLVTIDTSTSSEGSVAVGPLAHATGGQIALANNGPAVIFSEVGANCPDGEIIGRLKEVFGGSTVGFSIKTPKASLMIDKEGKVYVNGKLVGGDPEILTRALAFLLAQYVTMTNENRLYLLKR